MNHFDIQSRMADYLDGDLSLESRALFDAHLDQCDDCSRELTDMRDTIRLLRTLPNPEPPVDLVSDVMRRIAAGEGNPDWFGRILDQLSHWVVPRIAIPVTAVAAALTLTVMTGDLRLGPQKTPGVPSQSPATTIAGGHGDASDPGRVAPSVLPSAEQLAKSRRQPRVFASNRIPGANPRRNLQPRYEPETGAGQFLFRVANDQRGPTRRQPREGDVASRIFYISGKPPVGPYRGASMAPTLVLGRGNFGLGPTASLQGSGAGLERGVTPVAVSRFTTGPNDGTEDLSPEARRLRELDGRLRFLNEDPPGFAAWMANHSLAEQELWLGQLAARAEEIGEVGRVMSALEGSGDEVALQLARDFESAVTRNRASWAAAKVPSSSD